MNMKRIFKILILFVSLFIYSRCGDDFLNKVDETTINSASFYNTETDAIASINAAYAHLQNLSLWGRRIFFMLDFSSDEIGSTPNTQGPPFELLQHTFRPQGNEHIENPWQMFYKLIARTNITIREVSEMEINEQVKNEVLGQARFLRALGYFYINALWNGGPLKTEENLFEVSVERATPEQIWEFIESDLNTAIDLLPETWDEDNEGRATKGAAEALLGKTHLYQEDWEQAETHLMNVINGGNYYLVGGENDPNPVTTIDGAIAAMRTNHDFAIKNNPEAVFEVQFKSGTGLSWNSNSATGLAEGTVRPREYGVDGFSFYNAKPSDKLIAEFERINPDNNDKGNVDPRFQAFFFTEYDTLVKGEEEIPYSDILENSGYAWKKYQRDVTVQDPDDPNANDVNHDVIRYADVLLMAAEAKIMQNEIAEGIQLINQVRRRADPTGTILPDRPESVSQEEAIDFLIHERQIELSGEQVRRTDLVRWGIAAQNINNFQTNQHEYFPIPQSEIDANQALTEEDQNPGYR